MCVINFYEEAEKLKEGKTKRIVKGKDFDITLMKDMKGPSRLHMCGRDEFFFVLEGGGVLLLEDKLYTLKKGEGIMARAGEKHKALTLKKVCWLVISKTPHKHIYFEE